VYERPKSASFSFESGFSSAAEPRQKAFFDRGAPNVSRVRLGKNFEKHELIVGKF
jgi:hypothetical protein